MPSPRSDSSSPSPDEPTPTPDPMTSLLFQPPTTPDPTTTEAATEQDPHSWPDDASPSLSDLDGATASAPRSTGSTPRRKVRELLPMTTAAVQTAGGMAHTLLTVEGTPERAVGLYLPDEDDVAAVAEPLAGLASRRMPEGAENPDVSDIVRLALGLVGYIAKQLQKRASVVRQEHLEEQYAGDADQEASAA